MGLSSVGVLLLKEKGFPALSAQGLREQFILRQSKEGRLYEIAKNWD